MYSDSMPKHLSSDVSLRRQNAFQWLSRLGYAARGVVYLVIGWLAFALAMGWQAKAGDSKDAIRYLSTFDFGTVFIAILLVGLFAFAGWRFVQAVLDPDGHGLGFKGLFVRVGLLFSGVIYSSLALFVAQRFVDLPLPWSGSDRSYVEWAAILLSKPAGRWMVGIVAVIAVFAAIGHFVKAIRKTFLRYMDVQGPLKRWVTVISQVGLIARGSMLLIIGWYVGRVFVSLNPGHAVDQAGAIEALKDQPFGVQLAIIAAFGLMAFGVYGFAEAAFRRIHLEDGD